MNDLIIDMKSLELETIKNLRNSKSANTLRAYQSDYNDFSLFCSKNGFQAMPTQPKILALYITHLSSYSKYSTLKRRLASISILHKTKGHYIDTKHPIIMENLMGIKRTNGSNQKGKKPLLINDLKILINAIHQSNEKDKRKIRDKALVLIGFSGAVFLILNSSKTGINAPNIPLGNSFFLLNASAYAGYLIVIKRLRKIIVRNSFIFSNTI